MDAKASRRHKRLVGTVGLEATIVHRLMTVIRLVIRALRRAVKLNNIHKVDAVMRVTHLFIYLFIYYEFVQKVHI